MRVTAVLRTNPITRWTCHEVRESEKKRARRNETNWKLRRWSKRLNRFWTELRPVRGFVCRNCGRPFLLRDCFNQPIRGNEWYDPSYDKAMLACVDEAGDAMACARCMYHLTHRKKGIATAQQIADAVPALAYLKAYERAKKEKKI